MPSEMTGQRAVQGRLVKVGDQYGGHIAGFDLEITECFPAALVQIAGNGDLITVRVHIASVWTSMA